MIVFLFVVFVFLLFFDVNIKRFLLFVVMEWKFLLLLVGLLVVVFCVCVVYGFVFGDFYGMVCNVVVRLVLFNYLLGIVVVVILLYLFV